MTLSYITFSPKSDQDFDVILDKAIHGDSMLTFLTIFNAALHDQYTPGIIKFFQGNFQHSWQALAHKFYRDQLDLGWHKLNGIL